MNELQKPNEPRHRPGPASGGDDMNDDNTLQEARDRAQKIETGSQSIVAQALSSDPEKFLKANQQKGGQ